MKVSIIPNDNTVIVDGDGRNGIDLSHLSHVRAIHWDSAAGAGSVEYYPLPNRSFTAEADVAEPDRDTTIGATVIADAVAAHAAKKVADEAAETGQ